MLSGLQVLITICVMVSISNSMEPRVYTMFLEAEDATVAIGQLW